MQEIDRARRQSRRHRRDSLHDRGNCHAASVGGGASGNECVFEKRKTAVGNEVLSRVGHGCAESRGSVERSMGRSMMTTLLVANRGEIAVRIARACRGMGIESVLAYVESDDTSYTRRFFDDAAPISSYLEVDACIDAARKSGADALHPGYGFLAERAELAAACEDAGIVFVGPKSSSIAAMGSKSESRHLMHRLGVPVVPGYDSEDQSDATLAREAERIGLPLLIKPSAGGGGKGMKIVRDRGELQSSVESARREAMKAFGNDRLLLERYIEQPRHMEFQVFGGNDGEVIHLFERDCSIQRRYQKIVEESPAPRYPDKLRQKMAKAAIAAAEGVHYRNAGTVEFLVTP